MQTVNDDFASTLRKKLLLNLKHGPWIAGSMARKLYLGEEEGYSDWDIWVKNEGQVGMVDRKLKEMGGRLTYQTDNANTYKLTISKPLEQIYMHDSINNSINNSLIEVKQVEHTIQVVTCRYHRHTDDIFDNFDFTVCQVATDGANFVFSKNTKEDIKNKRLRRANNNHNGEGIVSRTLKYIVYGFTPDTELLQHLEDHKHTIDWSKCTIDYDTI